jgi:hypothetical protein
MKKILFYVVLLAIITIPVMSEASTANLITNGNYTAGNSYKVDVVVDPQQSKVYTAKVAIDFPASLLQVNDFVLSPGLMPLNQTGYDLVNNTSGSLIKTAGYSGGLSVPKTFGTITFYAKKSGSGTISLSSNSQFLDENNQNVFSGSQAVSFTVKSDSPANQNTAAVATVALTPPAVTSTTTSTSTATSSDVIYVSTSTITATSAATTTTPASASPLWFIGVGAIIVILVAGYFISRGSRGV